MLVIAILVMYFYSLSARGSSPSYILRFSAEIMSEQDSGDAEDTLDLSVCLTFERFFLFLVHQPGGIFLFE